MKESTKKLIETSRVRTTRFYPRADRIGDIYEDSARMINRRMLAKMLNSQGRRIRRTIILGRDLMA